MTIEYYFRDGYGKERAYIKDENIAKYIMAITGRVSIDRRIIACFEYLGIKFVEVVAPRKVK